MRNSNIICNENVFCNVEVVGKYHTMYQFTPTNGYALWRDNEEGNLDENGEPMCYWFSISALDTEVEEFAQHIWAKLIDETMEVFGDVSNQPEVATFGLRRGAEVEEEPSHTYIDENGVERDKKGVY